jgi:peptidoglycan/xylan/chitin deacetylase (PgdA/CDA1 family)
MRTPRRLWTLALAFALVPALTVLAPPRPAGATRSAYFAATGHNVADPFLRYYQEHGGLAIFGLPLTEPFQSGDLTVQYFERARFEYHPENPPGSQVELGQLGRELTAKRANEAPFKPLPGGTTGFYPQTGHTLQHGFAAYWQRHGGLAIFGYPISEEFAEVNPADGKTYTVQYFERARFEYHPEFKGTDYEVELGLLGGPDFALHGLPGGLFARAQPAPPPQPRALSLPVLMYHDVGLAQGRYSVPMDSFTAQLDWLQANGYQTVTLDDVYDYMFAGGDLPPKPVLLTFDDGRASQWNAVRELNARHMTGVFFIIAGYSGLTDDQLRQMIAWGHEIESHSMTHPFLTRVSDSQLAYEVTVSRQQLEARLGVPIDYFAYPDGDYDGRVEAAVAAAGYRGGIAAWGGRHWGPDKRWNEPRIEISGFDTMSEFIFYVTSFDASTIPGR